MYSEILNIKDGFASKDSKKIYSGLLSFIEKNKENIKFQKHPLGFKYFKLGKISSFEEFRLHFYINTDEKHDNELQIHDHSFDFESFVLHGSIINKKYEILRSENLVGYVYNLKFRNEKSRFILNSDNCFLNLTELDIINCGEFYELKSNEFHESIKNQDLTITLLKITKNGDKTCRIFSPKILSTLSSFERSTLPFEENIILIEKIIDLIHNKE